VTGLPHAEQQAVLVAATFEMLGLDHSIVLVDGPELHQSAAGVAAFARGILDLGADNQVIFATGSANLADELAFAITIDLKA
jgi:hypothetical protein